MAYIKNAHEGGQYRTQSLFTEFKREGVGGEPEFTFDPNDKDGCISIHRLYMEIADPTEYKFAMEVFGSWAHWQRIANGGVLLKAKVEALRDELRVKLKSDAIGHVIKMSKTRDAAAKYVAEEGWIKKRGRPSKAEVARETKVQQRTKETVNADMNRLGLSVVSD